MSLPAFSLSLMYCSLQTYKSHVMKQIEQAYDRLQMWLLISTVFCSHDTLPTVIRSRRCQAHQTHLNNDERHNELSLHR